jgi:L-iditol 2-dehydrogenase
MKAAVLDGLKSMAIKEVPIPKLKKESVLIKVSACAICGSDIRIHDTGNERVKYPAIIGHEIAGEVVEVGKGIKGFKTGSKVAIGADVPCGRCYWCMNGMCNCCDKNLAMGYQFQGGFAQYCLLEPVVIRHGPVRCLPEGVNPEHAALAEPLGCCINGFERVFFSPGKTLLVIGAGPIGILLVKLAKIFQASLTILCDVNESRLKSASIARPDYLINASKVDFIEKVMDITKGKGADFIFTACSNPMAQEQAVKLLAKRGFINFFGGLAKGSKDIHIDSNRIHYREGYITGSHGSTPRQHALAVDLITSKRIDMSGLITHRFPLDKIHDAFRAVRKELGLKVMVLPFK